MHITAFAVPAYPFPVQTEQADGSSITVQLRGDEWFSWAEDQNGYVIAFDNESMNWRYASIDSGSIVPNGEVVGASGVNGILGLADRGRITPDALAPLLVGEASGTVNPVVDSWVGLRAAVNAAPANVPTTIEIAGSFAAPTGALGAAIEVPVDRQITLVSTSDERILTQTNWYLRHFSVRGSLTLEQNITLSGGTVSNTNNSGGVQVPQGGTLTMNEGSVIENNRRPSRRGGAVVLYGTGVDESTRATFNMNGGVIRNNSALEGGGVSSSSDNNRINMIDGSITGNVASRSGGGVFLHHGGAIADGRGFYMVGGSITNNTAAVDGGGIFSHRSSIAGTVPETDYADLNIGENAIFSGNTAGAGASAPPDNRLPHIATTSTSIWDYALNNYDINYTGRLGETPGPINPVVDSWVGLRAAVNAAPANVPTTIEIANSFEAPYWTLGGLAIEIPADRQITLVSTNTAPGDANMRILTQTTNTSQLHFRVLGSLTLGQNITLSGGAAGNTNASGGVGIRNGTFTMNEGSVIENIHMQRQSHGRIEGFHAVVIADGTFYINGGTIRNNSGFNGGSVTFDISSVRSRMYMSGGYIIGNTAYGGAGGGIGMAGEGSVLNISGGTISDNSTDGSGGGVAVNGRRGTVNISGGTIAGNAARYGGGISIDGTEDTLNMYGGTIADNTATENGGGIIFGRASGNIRVNVYGGSITGNTASRGGGVFARTRGGFNTICTLNITGGGITNNTATIDGGGVYSSQANHSQTLPATAFSDLYIGEDAIFSGNTAGAGASLPPDNRLPHIATTSASIWGYALNNYDINYRGRLGETP